MGLSYPWQGRRNPLVIPAGSKRSQISVQAESASRGSSGGQSTTWDTVLTTMAAIATVSSREMYQVGQSPQFTAQVTHMVSFDWPGDSIALAGGMRVVLGSRIFTVQTVENVQERNRVINLMCLEINGVL